MTTGALLFAFDSEIKYSKLAVECARRIKEYLGIPVTLVTNKRVDSKLFQNQIITNKPKSTNKRYFADRSKSITWLNFDRNSALDHTPYDRTLLVDIDYMINSDDLLPILQSSQPFLCHRRVQRVESPDAKIDTFGTKNTQQWWATVVIFDRSKFSQDVFTAWKMIQTNYKHYANLFGFDQSQFRNDYALSLALLLCNGNILPTQCEIPWPLLNVNPHVNVLLEDNTWWIEYKVVDRLKKFCIRNKDLHIMGKSYLEKMYAL